jgi:curli biogenesis system outer membrane secretion channel CsgG
MKRLNKTALFAFTLFLTTSMAFGLFSRKTEAKDGNAELDLPPYDGIKHAIGVIPFENTSYWKGDIDLQENMTTMLENVLLQSGRFVVVERENLEETLAEQDLQSGGRAAKAKDVAATGVVRSAKYLARAQITGVEAEESGGSGGINVGKFSIGASGGKAQIEMIIKIFDSSTSEIIASQRIVGKAGKRGFSLGFSESGLSTSIGGFSKTPIGEAAYDCVAQAVVYLAHEFEDYKFEGSVVTVTGDGRIVINRGSKFNVQNGDRFQVREIGEVLTDPATGEVLDRIEGAITCTIEVDRVTEKVSYCKLVDGVLPTRGDSVVGI